MAHQNKDYSDSEEEWDFEAYFSKPYVPLSNLPTPPLSAHSSTSSRQTTPDFDFDDVEDLDPELLGPALHLSNLIPPTTSLTPPSSNLIQAMLARAALPSATLGLAAIILDSLTSRFALSWRKSLTHTLQSTDDCPVSIDALRPELLPLAALIIANKFLNDAESTTTHYAAAWGNNLWTAEQINVAQNAVCENLGWRIMPLCEGDLIEEAEETMRRMGEGVRTERLRKGSKRSLNISDDEELIGDDNCFSLKHGQVKIQSTEFVPVYGDFDMDFD